MADHATTPPRTRPLTPKQERFVIEYAKDFNATEAARRAGYTGKCLNRTASQLLDKTRHLIEQRKAEVMQKAGGTGIATLEQTLRLATARAFYDPGQMYDSHGNPKEVTDIPRFHRRGIAGFEVEELYDGRGEDRKKIGYVKRYKLVDSAPYVALLLKFHGAFPTGKAKEQLPPVPPTRWDTSLWTKEDWEDFKRLREKAKQRVLEAQVANGH